ncbi:MAG: PIF1 family DEAD/DEAH box helicase [Candidatus Saccharimonadales bacterium]
MTQQEALGIMHGGVSVLLTGAAGTGKTHTLNAFVSFARASGKTVAMTATTGLAATHLNGTTIHAWSGIGVHDALPKDHVLKMGKQRKEIITKTDVLVIDEISMLHDYRLDMVDDICRAVREVDEPFGGLQVILCGDFFQLPPVNRNDSKQGSFITNSNAWAEGDFTVCYLTEQYRQKEDSDYTDILNGIRAGVLTRRQLAALQARAGAVTDPWSAVTRLLTTNIDVDTINLGRLAELEGDGVQYEMVTSGSKQYVEQLMRSCLAPEILELKIGAHVMCIKNSLEKKYVNGSLGIVEGFEKHTNFPIVRLTNEKLITVKPDTWELVDGDKKRASASQIPLRLAWAITVHKSQGMTLDAARVDLSKAFVEGMGYVALSRVRGMEHLALDGLNGMALRVSPLAKQIDAELRNRSESAVKTHQRAIEAWQNLELAGKTELKRVSSKKGGWSEKLAAMRQDFPNAYKPWSDADDKKLVAEFSDGKTIPELSQLLGRHKGSIKVRLEKHFGEGVFDA